MIIKGHNETFKARNMFTILIVVVVSQVNIYVETYPIYTL